MNTEYVSQLKESVARRTPRMVAIEALGPLTMLGGVVWAIAQPYRVALFYPAGRASTTGWSNRLSLSSRSASCSRR